MFESKIKHDILNAIERLRIMYDITSKGDFSDISKEEIRTDLKETLLELEENFKLVLID